MESLFGWVSELVAWLVSWVPRIYLLRANERGVKYVYGSRVKEIGPGLHVYWPAVTEIDDTVVVSQFIALGEKKLMTDDGVPMIVDAVVCYSISDVKKFLVEHLDSDDAIDDIASAALRVAIVSRTYEELMEEQWDLDDGLTEGTQEALDNLGVEVEYVRITDLIRARPALPIVGDCMSVVIGMRGTD